MSIRLFIYTILAFPFFIIFGCSNGAGNTEEKTYSSSGIVYSVEKSSGHIVISHDAIPGLMGAMTMRFAVKKRRDLEKIKASDHVKFVISIGDGEYVINKIVRVSDLQGSKQ